MDITKHCQLCNHQIVDFKTGSICAITKRKPNFTNTCVNANFDEKLESKINVINAEYQSILKTKWYVFANFIIFFLIAIGVILAGYFSTKYLFNISTIGILPAIISLIVIIKILPIAIGPLNNYINDLKLSKTKKEELDAVLSIYNIKYHIDIYFGKKYHGTQDVEVDLKIKK